VHGTRSRPPVDVSADGVGVVSHVGARLLGDVADATTLTAQLSLVFAGRTAPQTAHDPGRVLVDLAVMLADGGETISDIAMLADQVAVFGQVASDSTCWRVLNSITAADLDGVAAARAAARQVAWAQRAEQTGQVLSASLVAGSPLLDGEGRPVLVIDDDATIVVTHSEKEHTAATFKHSYGYHPVLAFCDNTNEALAGMLRPGNAGSNTAADHIVLLDKALAQIPDEYRHGYPVLVRCDGAGASKAFLAHIRSLRNSGVRSEFSIGWAVSDREHTAIAALPARAWTPAVDIDGDPRESAAVAELTGALPAAMLADYPPGMRIVVRRERPHPGAQLDLIETRDGVAIHLLRHRHPSRPARLARRPAPLPRPGRRPHPHRQGHRPRPIPLAAVRNQPSVAGLRPHRHRPARLDTNHPAARPARPRQGRTEEAALPTAARRRPPRPRQPQTPHQDRPHLALGTRARPGLRPAPCTARPPDLNTATCPDEPTDDPTPEAGRSVIPATANPPRRSTRDHKIVTASDLNNRG
jgi:Transposase DDE domain group 1